MALEFHKSVLEEEDGFSNDSAITNSPPLCGNENGYVYKTTSYHHHPHPHPHPQEPQSLINFKPSNNILINSGESLLSFQQNHNLHQWGHHIISPRSSNSDPIRLIQDFNCIQTASTSKEKHQIESSYVGWLYSEEPNVPCDNNDNNCALQDSSPAKEAAATHKRLSMGESMQASKKQCTNSKTTKATKTTSPSKDPQSIAAKNRRERISERLKILQELVPNGSKVDLVTMLEKAISYVKFLQLQVKVLATDEFWPVQGGKAPDISQVREAIDAILSSQRDTNSVSK